MQRDGIHIRNADINSSEVSLAKRDFLDLSERSLGWFGSFSRVLSVRAT